MRPRFHATFFAALAIGAIGLAEVTHAATADDGRFEGKFFRGRGGVEYLQMLDIARRMFAPEPEFQNLAMLYMTNWNGLVEGPTGDAWWIQNSYGTTYDDMYAKPEGLWAFGTWVNGGHWSTCEARMMLGYSVTSVQVNDRAWNQHDTKSVFLPYDKTPDRAHIQILLGGVKPAENPTGLGL